MGGWKLKLGRHYKEGTPSVSFRVLYNEPPILCVGQSLSCVTPWLCLPTSYISSNAAGFRSGTDTHTPWHTFPITVTHRTGTRTCKQTERAEMWLYSQITVWKRCRVYITVVWIHSWTPTYHTLKKKLTPHVQHSACMSIHVHVCHQCHASLSSCPKCTRLRYFQRTNTHRKIFVSFWSTIFHSCL